MIWKKLKSLFVASAPAIVRSESLMPLANTALSRRGFIIGSSAAVSVLAAPVIVKAESLMAVRPVVFKRIFLDTVQHSFESDDRTDKYLLDCLMAEANQFGMEIRRPQFMNYVTGDLSADPVTRRKRRNIAFGWQQQHRRCMVELVDAPWLRRVS